jgi:hypothetical protein
VLRQQQRDTSSMAHIRRRQNLLLYIAEATVTVGFTATDTGAEPDQDPGSSGSRTTRVRAMLWLREEHGEAYTVPVAGVQHFDRPQPGPSSPVVEPADLQVELSDQAAGQQYDAPVRITQHGRVGASDGVWSFGPDLVVVDALAEVLEPVYGKYLPAVRAQLREHFESKVLRPLLPQLTNGRQWSATVSKRGTTAKITIVSARAVADRFVPPLESARFDIGGVYGTTGLQSSGTESRRFLGTRLAIPVPHAQILGRASYQQGQQRNWRRETRDVVGARVWVTETVGQFKGRVELELKVEVRRPSRLWLFPQTDNVTVVPNLGLVFPKRDLIPVGTEEATAPVGLRTVPERIRRTHRLGHDDVAARVFPVNSTDLRHPAEEQVPVVEVSGKLSDSLHAQLDQDKPAFVSKRQWRKSLQKLAAQLDAKLHPRVKQISAGEPWTIELYGIRVEVTASILRLRPNGQPDSTQFIAGPSTGSVLGDVYTTLARHDLKLLTFGVDVLGSTDPTAGELPVAGLAGLGGVYTRRADEIRDRLTASLSRHILRSKGTGSGYTGLLALHLRFTSTRKPSRAELRIGLFGIDTLSDSNDTRLVEDLFEAEFSVPIAPQVPNRQVLLGDHMKPVSSLDPPPAAEPAEQESVERPVAAVSARTAVTTERVPVPPASIWEHGLPDHWWVRDLAGYEGITALLRLLGPMVYGKRWHSRVVPAARRGDVTASSFALARAVAQLPAMLRTAGRRLDSGTTAVGPSWPNRSIEMSAELVSLSYERDHDGPVLYLMSQNSAVLDERHQGSRNRGGRLTGRALFSFGDVGAAVGGRGDVAHIATQGVQGMSQGRPLVNSKHDASQHLYNGHIKVTFTGRRGDQSFQLSGLVPVQLGALKSGGPFEFIQSDGSLLFTREHPEGASTRFVPPATSEERSELVGGGRPGPAEKKLAPLRRSPVVRVDFAEEEKQTVSENGERELRAFAQALVERVRAGEPVTVHVEAGGNGRFSRYAALGAFGFFGTDAAEAGRRRVSAVVERLQSLLAELPGGVVLGDGGVGLVTHSRGRDRAGGVGDTPVRSDREERRSQRRAAIVWMQPVGRMPAADNLQPQQFDQASPRRPDVRGKGKAVASGLEPDAEMESDSAVDTGSDDVDDPVTAEVTVEQLVSAHSYWDHAVTRLNAQLRAGSSSTSQLSQELSDAIRERDAYQRRLRALLPHYVKLDEHASAEESPAGSSPMLVDRPMPVDLPDITSHNGETTETVTETARGESERLAEPPHTRTPYPVAQTASPALAERDTADPTRLTIPSHSPRLVDLVGPDHHDARSRPDITIPVSTRPRAFLDAPRSHTARRPSP